MTIRRGLFTKYVTLIVALVAFVLVASSAVGLYFSSQENVTQLEALQHEKAVAAATRIELYIKDIEHQMAWTTLPQAGGGGSALEQRRYEYLKLLRQAPAISELAWVDRDGKEQLRVSRLALDVAGSGIDLSGSPFFKPAVSGVYYGPVYFRKETEPYMTIARPAGGSAGGVIAAEVNLKFVWEVVTQINAGPNGVAYVVNSDGTLIAHPDISLVLQKTSLASLPQVAAVMHAAGASDSSVARDPRGRKVLSAAAPIPTLGWHVFVEAPLEVAFAPLYASIWRTAILLVASLILAVLASLFLARRMVRPIRALQAGTEMLAKGQLDQRIDVRSGDELEALATQFNDMAGKLGESYKDLERKVEARTRDLAESLAQQTATSDVLRVISGSIKDVQPVFDAIVQSCSVLFGGGRAALWLVEGDVIRSRARAGHGLRPDSPRTGDLQVDRETAVGTCILDQCTIHMADVEKNLDRYPMLATRGALAQGFHSMLLAPLVSGGKAIGALMVLRPTVGEFSEKEQALLNTFADQATIAIENVRLFNETHEALRRQTATADVLKIISSTPGSLEPVLDVIMERVTSLCDAHLCLVNLYKDGRQRTVAQRGGTPEFARWLMDRGEFEPPAGSASARVMTSGEPVHIHDYRTLPLYEAGHPMISGMVELGGVRTYLNVPMVKDGRPLGSITIYRREVRPFTDKQIDVVRGFADQAVIAIENVRLFNETKEALDQQTATSEVLEVISTTHVSADVKPVFEAILEKATKLCDAQFGAVGVYDGALYHNVVARAPENSEYAKGALRPPWAPPPGSHIATMIAEARPVHVPDGTQSQAYLAREPRAVRLVEIAGARTWLAVPMIKQGRVIGGMMIYRTEVKPFTEKQIELVSSFAQQAVIAIENVRLFNETREALEQQTATSEILKVISRTTSDVRPVFEAIVNAARDLASAAGARVFTFDGERIHFVTGSGTSQSEEWLEYVRKTGPTAPSMDLSTGRAILTRQVVVIEDTLAEGNIVTPTNLVRRRVLTVPMLREGAPIGVLSVGWDDPGPVPGKIIALIQTFADQAVIAIENVRLFNETREALEQQTATSEILNVISRTTTDVRPVFEAIVNAAKELAGASGSRLFTYDGELVRFETGAGTALTPEWLEFARQAYPSPATTKISSGRAILTKQIVQWNDSATDPRLETARGHIRRRGVAVPMLREGQPMGALTVGWDVPGEVPEKVVKLIQTFADQAVIAIENVRLFNEIQDKSRQLEIANKHKSEFLANMSHELRTPLNAIIGFSEVLQDSMFGELNEEQLEFIRDIHESGKHLLSLINDILDLSKVEAGRMELMVGEFDLPSAINNAIALVKERAAKHRLHLATHIDPSLGVLRADERKLKQILLNLLSNAVKFTPEGGSIKVSARPVDNGVEIAVADTGVGIAAEDRELVFEEFRQVGKDYTRKAEGTGLGLALTRKFVQLHGGHVRLDSEVGKGSTFTVFIPNAPMMEAAHGE